MRSVLFQNAYFRFTEVKNGQENLLISRTDQLTGIENRRGLVSSVGTHESGWKLRGDYVTLVMFDVDFFKQYNDYFGHIKGDEALQDIVSSITSAFPSKSLDFFRYGGDEFIIFFDEPNMAVVESFCKKILVSVRNKKIKASPDASSPYLSITLGAKTMKANEIYTLNEHIDQADKLLYKAKNEAKGEGIVNGAKITE